MPTLWWAALWAVVGCLAVARPLDAQLFDALEQLPLRWQLAENDCHAKVVKHQIDPTGGHDRGPCEAVTLAAGHGTRLLLEYRISPSHVLDDLQAQLWVRSAQPGVRLGVRVRYPYVHDESSGRTVAAIVFGGTHRQAGKWEKLRIDNLPRRLREKEAAIRVEHGADADLRGAFVDAVLVDVYNQPGMMTIRLDDLSVEQMVPVGSVGVAARPSIADPRLGTPAYAGDASLPAAFASDSITRILEYHGEPLSYLRSLGFDAVLLSQPPTAEILREASRARMLIYAPPPSAPNPDWETLLEPVAGWYLGTSQDRSKLAAVQRESERLAAFPRRWQRATLIAPAEAWSEYAALVPSLVHDLPPTTLGLQPAEEQAYLSDIRARTKRSVQVAVGVQISPPSKLIQQLNAFANHVGASPVDDYGWHGLWLQSMRALQQCPQAIVFRSSSSLASGLPVDQKRALAVGFVNRCIEAISPLVARATPAGAMRCDGANYDAQRLSFGSSELILASTRSATERNVSTGEVELLRILPPPTMAHRFAWRLTGMTAERLDVANTPQGLAMEISVPDAVEIVLISDDPSLGHRISTRLARLAMPAALDRWQLTSESVFQTRSDWDSLVAAGVVAPAAIPRGLLAGAANTLVDGEPLYRGGDGPGTLRLARRADSWMMRSRARMLTSWQPPAGTRTSFPALLAPGAVPLQVALLAQTQTGQWSRNLLPIGAFRSGRALAHSGWSHDRRIQADSRSRVEVLSAVDTGNPSQADDSLLRVEVVSNTDSPLPGGYAGTAVRVRSPAVDCPADRLVRVTANVRTLGFGGAFQGVLVYDSLGGPELGVLVRGADQWQRVEIYRHTAGATPLHVMFEVIGAGEAMIEDVSVQLWDEQPADRRRLRPISP